jgi:hypothetical protein
MKDLWSLKPNTNEKTHTRKILRSRWNLGRVWENSLYLLDTLQQSKGISGTFGSLFLRGKENLE